MDLGNNRDHYYLAGPMGNHVGMQVDADGDDQTDRELRSQVFDAFGVAVTPGLFATGRYAFRGQEGSATDDSPGLIEMGARSYDPQLGRFIQADSLPVSNVTTQGMNRYIYCENDPVNFSDPFGLMTLAQGLGLALGGLAVASGIAALLAGGPMAFFGLAAAFTGLSMIFDIVGDITGDCKWYELRNFMGLLAGLSLVAGVASLFLFAGLPATAGSFGAEVVPFIRPIWAQAWAGISGAASSFAGAVAFSN